MRDIERVKGSERADFERGDAVHAVVNRAGRAGKVKDVVDFAHVERLANIFLDKFETRIVAQVLEVGAASGEQIVDDDHAPAFAEQGVAQMRSQETGAAGD